MLDSVCVFIVSFLLFLCSLWYALQYRYFKYLRYIPGPMPFPLIGHAWCFSSLAKVLPTLMQMKTKYGGLYQVILGFNPPSLTITDPKFLEFLLGSTKILDKSIDYKYLHGWLGKGLLTSTGSKWRRHRKLITPAFHFKILEGFVDVFRKNSDILIENLKREIDKESFDVYPYITLLALDIICETALGVEVHAQVNHRSEYVDSVKEMCKIIMERTFNPFLQNDFLYKFTEVYRREQKALKVLHGFTVSVIELKKREFKSDNLKCNSQDSDDGGTGIKKKLAFLDLLLQTTLNGEPLSDTDIREEVDTFMFEGHDTTASAISFILFCLSNEQEVQKKVVEELDSIYSDRKERSSTFSDLQKMKYLEAVIKETLRLYPSVPLYAREVKEDITYDDKLLPRGTRLTVFAFGAHRDPQMFPEPEKFNPGRFLSTDSNVQHTYTYIPFSAGPRNCIGQKFAMLEMKATVSKILTVYELLPAEPKHKLTLSAETTLKSANGINIKIRKRDCFK